MKQKFYSLFLIALLGMTGMQSWAQTPEPTAKWTFDNTEDLMAPSVGSLTLTPCVIPGNSAIALSTVSDAGIETADGPTEDNKAIFVPKASALMVGRAAGAEATQSYTVMMDVKAPDANAWNALLQMGQNNQGDGDLFIHEHKIGVASLGGYYGNIKDDTWYRVVFSYRDGKNILYVNGTKLREADPDANSRFTIQPFGFYLLCDEDGEKSADYLAEVAFWDTPLTDDQVAALGSYVPTMEIATANDLLSFAEAVNEGEAMNGVLTADINMAGIVWDTPIGTSGNAFGGIFDGQGHTITGFDYTSTIDGGGLFGVTNGATIKNFSIYGALVSTSGTGSGVVGYPTASTISGIHSYLEIDVPNAEVHHVGGVVGSARGSNTIIGCTFHGSMQVAAGSTDNFAGIVAYLGGDNVSYCANYGTITFDDVNCAAGGIAGYCNNTGSYVQFCLNMGAVTYSDPEGNPQYGGAIVGRLRTHDVNKMTGDCWLEGSAPSAGKGDGNVVNLTTAFKFKAEQLPTGEVCYMLNGDQSVIGWYQTLPGDQAPVILDSTHGQVYKNGRLHCNGDTSEDTNFSNENLGTTQDDHNPVDGFCDYCGLFYPDFFTPNADGFYEIANAKQLCWFEHKVNLGELTASAILTADIDFADLLKEGETEIDWTPIGDWGATRGVNNAGFQGHFDGQGHTIRNLNATSKQNWFGLFGVISSNCVIENFDIYGTLKSTVQYCGGVAAYSRDANPTIRNVHSFVNINNTSAGGRQGGILGCASVNEANYKTFIENCTYSGTLDGNDAGGSGNYGGMVGYANSSTSNYIDITNCLFDGECINNNASPGGCTFGGFIGYCNSAVITIKNSLSIGKVESAIYGQFFGAIKNTKSSMPNSYYIGDILNGTASTVTLTATETDMSQLASGEIAWKLNEESFIDAVWHQVLNEETYPVPYGNQGIVYETSNGSYENIDLDPDAFQSFLNDIIAKETEFIEDENLIAYQVYIDEYKADIDSWEDIDNLADFLEAYKASMELKESIKVSAANYALYIQACEDAVAYIEENRLEGETTDILIKYLEDDVEPDAEEYPNGSYVYIMDNLNLDDEALAAEILFVNQMLEAAVAADGIVPGNDITRLLVNSTFTEGEEDNFGGWTKEAGEGTTFKTGGAQDVMNIARGKGNDFDIQQTISELPNGIYMMALNGMFRPGGDIYSQFYAGQLYLNNTYNYFMVPGEDVILEDAAENEVNSYSDDAEYINLDGDICFVPTSLTGCSYAYSAGRYQNFVATEVTDGTLTVGMRNLGTGLGNDWMPFGNLHLIYLGSADEADENGKLTEVLEGYKARAEVLLNFEYSSDNEDFVMYPNMSEELKSQLAEAIEAVDGAQDKMALINTFSDLFNKAHASRKAYIAMYDAANKLSDFIGTLMDLQMITEEECDLWEGEIADAQAHYDEGDVSTEEALEIADRLNNCDLTIKPVDGVYQLASARDVALFAMLVNSGSDKIDAVLTDDIDFADLVPAEGRDGTADAEAAEINWTPIGDWGHTSGTANAAFRGHFDGQGHSIKNLNATSGQNFFGLFGVLSDGAVIENFTISGTYNSTFQYCGGAVGYARDTEVVIRNVHSYVNINNSSAGGRQGGVLGTAQNGKTTVENCTYSGTLDGNDAGGGGNYGGIIGYINNSSAAIAVINNCLFDGQVVNNNATPGNCTFGGIVGYNNSGTATIKNCLSIGTVRSARYSQFFGAINGNNSTFANNYYVGDNVNGSGSGGTVGGPAPVKVTTYQLACGEICYNLNAGQDETNWFQSINEDAYPVLDPKHETVLFNEEEGFFYNLIDGIPVGINEIESADEPETQTGIFNLAGQRLEKLQKGINIVNGKKVLY